MDQIKRKMNPIRVYTPLKEEVILSLRAGEEVLLSGIVYTARDAAHLRMIEILRQGKSLPFTPEGQIIYYTAPTPTPPGKVIGSCGPTSSYRMDELTLPLLKSGIKGTIGKGQRSLKLRRWLREYKAIYFLALAGGGAYLSTKVKTIRLVAFEDLGPEAIYQVEVDDFPLVVGIDAYGEDIYRKLKKRGRVLL